MDFITNSLAVDYLMIGVFSVIKNLMTWIDAVFVFSLWKFRNSSPYSVEPREDAASEERLEPSLEKSSSSSSAPVLSPATDATVFGATKGKITVFFGEDEVDMKEGEEKYGGDDDEAAMEGVGGEWWWSGCDWERRSGETEWYSCQDVTFINGNVVRLWDDVKTRLLPLSNGVC